MQPPAPTQPPTPPALASAPHTALSPLALRALVVVGGIALPYLVRVPFGSEWLMQYLQGGWGGFAFLQSFHILFWLPLLGLSWLYRDRRWLWLPVLASAVPLAWMHASLDLSSDALAAMALVLIPVLVLAPMSAAALIAWLLDRRGRRAAS